jgi:GT2 family glycosyltransferase
MPTPRVSVIIVNWNRREAVRETLDSLERTTYPSHEFIVIDNGSTDGSAEDLARVEGIRLIRCSRNLGPARARNIGVFASQGEYILFVDSDSLVSRRCLERLVSRMDSDPDIGIIGCKIVNPFNRAVDQWIYSEPETTHARREFETYSFSAAGALVRTEAIRKAGGFWGALFIYNEELDLSIRVLRAGFKILYAPYARVFHRHLERGTEKSRLYWHYQIRNHIWIFFRYYPWPICWWMIAMYVSVYLIKALASRQLGACLSGIVAGVRRRKIISRYRDKLTARERHRLRILNRRTSIRLRCPV